MTGNMFVFAQEQNIIPSDGFTVEGFLRGLLGITFLILTTYFLSNNKISEIYISCLNDFIEQYKNSFLEIKIVTPNEDYDLFCQQSKNNEIRNNQSIFLGKSSVHTMFFIDVLFDSYITICKFHL